MSDELADIYTQLKRSYLRGTGLRLNNEAVKVLYKRADEDAAKVAEKIAEHLFSNSFSRERVNRLVLELKNDRTAGGWGRKSLTDAVYRILKEEVKG